MVTTIVLSIQYDRAIGGHLKLAADANNTALAQRKITLATEGMEAWGLCNEGGKDCFSSVIYRTPDEDVGFWRENIQNTLADLENMSDEERADNLIESNQLMKVRETLLDNSSSGDKVTSPEGISRYPNNVGFAWWMWGSVVVGIGGFFLWAGANDRGRRGY
jgi:hypothetical protein